MLTEAEIESMRATVEETMTMTCTVEAPDTATLDPNRNPGPSAWLTAIADLPCVLWDARAAGEMVGPNVNIVAGERLMKIPVATAITEAHRVAEVTNSLGETIAGPLNIRQILIRPTHKVLRFDEVA